MQPDAGVNPEPKIPAQAARRLPYFRRFAGARTTRFFDPVDHAGEVHALMAKGEFQTCFARQYFRFTFQRMEDDAKDGCLLRSLQDEALAGKPVAEVLKLVALAPAFKRRDVR